MGKMDRLVTVCPRIGGCERHVVGETGSAVHIFDPTDDMQGIKRESKSYGSTKRDASSENHRAGQRGDDTSYHPLLRTQVDSDLSARIQFMRRKGLTTAVLYIDIDDFKKINDAYGHSGGDAVLEHFGKLLREDSRASDLIGRLGGEEFAVLLPETGREGALRFAQKIRTHAERTRVPCGATEISYTVSIGFSICEASDNLSLEELIRQADTALYVAKKSGKNCVMEYGDVGEKIGEKRPVEEAFSHNMRLPETGRDPRRG